jgi:hypothetical protein
VGSSQVEDDGFLRATKVRSTSFPPASLLDVSANICQIALVDQSGMIRTQMRAIEQKMDALHETLCMIPPRNSSRNFVMCL